MFTNYLIYVVDIALAVVVFSAFIAFFTETLIVRRLKPDNSFKKWWRKTVIAED